MAKQKFKITNWPAYDKALRQRGSLTVWLDESAISAWTDSAQPEGRGRPLHYTDMAITTILMMKRVFNLSLRTSVSKSSGGRKIRKPSRPKKPSFEALPGGESMTWWPCASASG